MYEIDKDNMIFSNKKFLKDKYKYFIAYKILSDEIHKIYSNINNYIIMKTNNHSHVWIWTDDNISFDDAKEIIETVKTKFDKEIVLTVKKEFYDLLKNNNVETKNEFEMGALHCEEAIIPKKSIGYMEKATKEDIKIIKTFLKDEMLETDDLKITDKQAEEDSLQMINNKHLYVYKNFKNKIVSMANFDVIGDMAKINHVYTDVKERNKGYCAGLIYGISNMLLANGITPMLYTDYNYAPSNKSYKNVGYKDDGIMVSFELA